MILKDKVFISTTSESKSIEIGKIFANLGATIVNFPMIEVVPAQISSFHKTILSKVEKFDWIIFTSSNGIVNFLALYEQVNQKLYQQNLCKIAVIGKSSNKILIENNIQADFVGSGRNGESFIIELMQLNLIKDKLILLALGDLAPDTAADLLLGHATPTRLNVYNTIHPQNINTKALENISEDNYAMILFTSPSAVNHFFEIYKPSVPEKKLRIASIGKTTANAVENIGWTNNVIASEQSYAGLAQEIIKYYNNLNN